MKTKLFTVLLVLASLCAQAQFRRSSDHKVYPYTSTLLDSDVMIVGRISPDTNYNFLIKLNLLSQIGGVNTNSAILISSNQVYLATNNLPVSVSTTTVTNIATYIVTNNIYVVTNNFAPTNTGVAGQVLHTTGPASPTRWDYVNQTLTNSNPVVPDFNLPVNAWTTNAAFLFLSCANVDTTGKKLQVTDVIVTNSTAVAIAVTFPATIHVTGTANITNLSVFHFRQFANLWTNCACEPVW